jgi:DNA mismatch endonuclease (patch repair protein)
VTDNLTKAQRSRNMSRIRAKDTGPEMTVRSMLHKLGYRFRLHSTKLPGRPDVVLPKHKAVVLVHGCFWHHHAKCRRATMPTSNRNYWRAKLLVNRARDVVNAQKLKGLGWKCIVIWECELGDEEELAKRLIHALHCRRTSP